MEIPLKIRISTVVCFLLCVAACDDKHHSGGSGIDYPGTQTGWTAYAGNPVITMGDALAGAQWNDPCVLKEGATYVMYLTANTGAPGENVVPFRATSLDGLAWSIDTTPLLATGSNPGDFDYAKVETPSVVFFNGEYHMYYTGVQTDFNDPVYIGHATSPDGLVWTKDPANPAVSPTLNQSDWNGWHTGEPGAVVFNSKVYLYFTAAGLRGASGPVVKRTIGMAISDDGFVFGASTQVLEQGTLYTPEKNYEGYSTPSALVVGLTMHLFYDVVRIISSENPDWVQFTLHHAQSSDGVGWAEDALPIFVRIDASWTRREVRAPVVIHDSAKFKMWFAGDDFISSGVWGIGYADAEEGLYP